MIMAALATPAMAERAPTSLRRAAGATDPAALSSLLHQLLADNDRSACAEIINRDMDESGRSPLHHACWRGALANVETLLDLGCDHGAWSTGLHSRMLRGCRLGDGTACCLGLQGLTLQALDCTASVGCSVEPLRAYWEAAVRP